MTKGMTMRNATIEDLKAVTELEAVCFPEAEAATAQSFEKRLRVYPDHFWLLEENEVLVGFINGMVTDQENLKDEMYEDAGMHDENGAWQMIFGVNTRPEYRRKGCAARMIKQVIRDAREQRRKGLVLTCKKKLIPYYAKFGFVKEGISESTHGDVVWYQMRLVFQ